MVNHRDFEPGSKRDEHCNRGYEETVLKEALKEMNDLDVAVKEVRLLQLESCAQFLTFRLSNFKGKSSYSTDLFFIMFYLIIILLLHSVQQLQFVRVFVVLLEQSIFKNLFKLLLKIETNKQKIDKCFFLFCRFVCCLLFIMFVLFFVIQNIESEGRVGGFAGQQSSSYEDNLVHMTRQSHSQSSFSPANTSRKKSKKTKVERSKDHVSGKNTLLSFCKGSC